MNIKNKYEECMEEYKSNGWVFKYECLITQSETVMNHFNTITKWSSNETKNGNFPYRPIINFKSVQRKGTPLELRLLNHILSQMISFGKTIIA